MVSGHLQIKKGYYYAVINYLDAYGKRHTKWVATGLPEKGNKRKAQAILTETQANFIIPTEKGDLSPEMLFADYLEEWLEIVKGRVKLTTYSSYQGMLNNTIIPYFHAKKIKLKDLEARHLQQFYTEKLRKVSANSVIHYHAVIHQALKYAVKTDMLMQNVATKIDRPKKNGYRPNYLDRKEMEKLFEIIKGTKLELPVLVASFYGLRRGEVVGLKWVQSTLTRALSL